MKRLLAIVLATAAANAAAQDGSATLVDVLGTSDTEGFKAWRARVGILPSHDNAFSHKGVALQMTRYLQDGFRKEVPGVVGIYRDLRRDTLAGLEVEAGVVRVSGRLRPIGDATYRMAPAPGTFVDFIASADLVETPLALERGIGTTFAAVGIERALSERWTATALGGWQSFSDGNARPHLRARLIWLAVPEHGITLQARYRQFSTREEDVGGAYFNPRRYQQALAVAAIRKRYAGWNFSGALGYGREQSSGAGSRPSSLAEARAEGPIFGSARLAVTAGYYRSAGFIDDPDYAYRRIGATVVVPF